LAGGFLLFLGWQFYLHAHHVSAPADFARLNAGTQWQHVDRLVPVLLELARNLADWRAWTLLWEGALAAFFVLFCQGEVRRASFFLFALLPPLCFDVAVCLCSAWPDYLLHLNLSLSRLLLQSAPTAAVGLARSRTLPCRLIEKPQQPSAGRRGLRLTDATATRCKEKRY
jgi:hypothetical protein